MNIVIVESAAKAKTINKYLGQNYRVIASFGHVRDLPAKDGSVLPDDDFAMLWEIDGDRAKTVNEIARAVKGADRLILATDPDREGEAISWHLMQILQEKRALKGVKVERVAFNAVTKDAIMAAMARPREIDAPLVDAYLARRALDYLVGFTLSPVLWRKLPGAKSAGRVQSVALRLVVDREAEIAAFVSREYWTLTAQLKTSKGDAFTARLVAENGAKFDRFDIADETIAMELKRALEQSSFTVASVEAKEQMRHPAPPFTTSTLQQEASRKLSFSAKQTMQVAQRLYEGVDIGGETAGLITYMRTDGVQIVPEAIAEARQMIGRRFGDAYLPKAPRAYQTKAKNAQEAHEAVRPTDFGRHPDDMARHLKSDMAGLYRLVWQRAVASQMASARLERTTADIDATGPRRLGLRATGTVVKFDGFLKLYQEGRDDSEGEDGALLPAMVAGDRPARERIDAKQSFTEPPPRYTEATLIKRMEELGIGRPSTYAATLAVLAERDYVTIEQRRLTPQGKGQLVTAFLESFFKRYVEYDFTADLEEKLDLISDGKLAYKTVLAEFWRDFIAAVENTKELRVSEVLDALNDLMAPALFPGLEDNPDARVCPVCGEGHLGLKLSKFGPFIGCSRYPDCKFTRRFGEGAEAGETAGDRELGADPSTGEPVVLKAGRFGPYVQLGEAKDGEKPKRASLPKGITPDGIDLAMAVKLLSLPRLVGAHPETGKPIVAGIGRYGPFVESDGKYANLDSAEEVFIVGLNRAVAALAEPKKGRAGGATVLASLGDHPDGGKVEVLEGKYGAYVKHGAINATLPKGADPAAFTLAEALPLLEARAANGGAKGKKPARKVAAKTNGAAKPKATKADGKSKAAKAPAKQKAAGKTVTKSKAAAKPKTAAKSKAAAAPVDEAPF